MTAGTSLAASRLRLLLVDGNPNDLRVFDQIIQADPSSHQFDITAVDSLAGCVAALSDGSGFDLVAASLELRDSQGFDTLRAIQIAAAGVPVVVLASPGQEANGVEAVRRGAEDYLIASLKPAELLARRLQFAIERDRRLQGTAQQKQQREADGQVAEWEALSAPPATEVTSRIYHSGALREVYPDEFGRYVASYKKFLEGAVERRVYKVAPPKGDPVRELAESLGDLHASPRDVIEIHLDALKSATRGLPAAKSQAFLEESRLLILDLMGKMAGFYRSFHVISRTKGNRP